MAKRYYKGKRVKGLPINMPIAWKYVGRWREKKVKHGGWRFNFTATKRRKARSYGGLGKGTTGAWLIKGIQRIKKIGKGKYHTVLKGTKKSLGFRVRKPKRYHR